MSSWYEVLGVPRKASHHEIHHAYRAKVRRLHPDRLAGAPPAVEKAANDALVQLNEAWRVLGNSDERARYDHQLATDSSVSEPSGADSGIRHPQSGIGTEVGFGNIWMPGSLGTVLAGLEAIADWLTPHEAKPRRIAVPDLRGMKSTDAWYVASEADLHLAMIQLTDHPASVAGTVVGQEPAPGTRVKPHSTLTVRVRHPPAM